MDPLTDFDRTLREAMQVEPSGDFVARIRTRVAEPPRQLPVRLPGFALAAMTCALLAVVTATVWRETTPFVADPVLPHRDLIVLSQPPRVVSSPPQLPQPNSRAEGHAPNVVVSRSEMLALQRLFSGLTVAPPQLEAPPDELSIPEIVIEPLLPLAGGPEGERQ